MDSKATTYPSGQPNVVEINFIVMLHYILKHWRAIALWGIIMGVLLGGTKFAKAYSAYQSAISTDNRETLESELDKSAQESEADAQLTESTVALIRANTERVSGEIEDLEEYLKNSVLMNIDPNNVHKALISYYIDTNYQINPNLSIQNPDKTDSVVQAYVEMLEGNALEKKLSGKINANYLRELISVRPSYDRDMISITIVADSDDLLSQIAEAVKDQMEVSHQTIDKLVAPHELRTISDQQFTTSDMGNLPIMMNISSSGAQANDYGELSFDNASYDAIHVSSLQQAAFSRLDALQNNLNDYKKQLNDIENPQTESSTANDASTQVVSLPVLKAQITSSAKKYGILGLILGLILGMIWYAVVYATCGRIMDPGVVMRKYNVRILGEYFAPVKKGIFSGLDRLIDRMTRHSREQENIDNVCAATGANVKAIIKSEMDSNTDSKPSIIVVGKKDTLVKKLASAMPDTENVRTASDILYSHEGIEALSSSDMVVLLVEREKTPMADLNGMIAQIQAQQKKLAGLVVA